MMEAINKYVSFAVSSLEHLKQFTQIKIRTVGNKTKNKQESIETE